MTAEQNNIIQMPSSCDVEVIIHVLESQKIERVQVADNLVFLLVLVHRFSLKYIC